MSGKITSITLGFLITISSASAHNKDATSIRKTLKPIFTALNAPVPTDYVSGKRVERIDGKSVEVYTVKAGGELKGVVGKVEVDEILYAIGVDSKEGKIVGVSKSGKVLKQDEIDTLGFVKPISEGLLKIKDKG